MITDKETNIICFSELFKTDPRFSKTWDLIVAILDSFNIEYRFLPHTKDIWARDYMPVQISEEKFVEFRYDPDYLQGAGKGNRDLKTYPDIVCDGVGLKTIKSDIILDGGNVVRSKDCVILTDKIVKENKFLYSKTELINQLKSLFEVDKLIIIPRDPYDIYGHTDGMLRFIDDETVLVNGTYRSDKKIIEQIAKSGINIEFLQFDVKKEDERNWAYINFLQTNDLIMIPELNVEEDHQAFEQMKSYFPEYANRNRIIQVGVSYIVRMGGALNCISWTIKE